VFTNAYNLLQDMSSTATIVLVRAIFDDFTIILDETVLSKKILSDLISSGTPANLTVSMLFVLSSFLKIGDIYILS
jgi:hypothetical protein